MAYQVPQDVRTILPSLAEAIFPIEAWTKQKVPPKYDQLIPPLGAAPSVPWRPVAAPATLSTTNFEIVRFLEILADNDGPNIALAPRWNEIKADPTRYFKNRLGTSAATWRAERGLEPANVKFGAVDADSSNFAFVAPASDGTSTPVSRIAFYDSCWPSLKAAHDFNPPAPGGWVAFRDNLRTDQFPTSVWPTANAIRSSAFIRQFTIDVLNACLGQKNAAITANDPVWQRAVLIEAGENRYRGNKYTPQQAARAVDAFSKAL